MDQGHTILDDAAELGAGKALHVTHTPHHADDAHGMEVLLLYLGSEIAHILFGLTVYGHVNDCFRFYLKALAK